MQTQHMRGGYLHDMLSLRHLQNVPCALTLKDKARHEHKLTSTELAPNPTLETAHTLPDPHHGRERDSKVAYRGRAQVCAYGATSSAAGWTVRGVRAASSTAGEAESDTAVEFVFSSPLLRHRADDSQMLWFSSACRTRRSRTNMSITRIGCRSKVRTHLHATELRKHSNKRTSLT